MDNKIPLSIHVISQIDHTRIGGGAEFFLNQLKDVFQKVSFTAPDTQMLSYPEITRVKHSWEKYLSKREDIPKHDAILTLGIGGYCAPADLKTPRINVFQGNWCGFRNYCYSIFSKSWWSITLRKLSYEKRSGRNALNIAPSQFIADILKDEGLRNIRLVRNFPEQAITGTEKGEYILFVGRATREKGFDIFLKIAEMRSNNKFLAVIFGNEKLPKIPPNMELIRNHPHWKMKEIYEKSYVLVFPSMFEGNSYTVLEALASDTPVITSAVGIAADLEVFPGKIIRSRQAIDYSRALDILDEEEIFPRKFLIKNYSPAIIRDEWMEALESIL